MIITRVCKDCGRSHKMKEATDKHYKGYHYRPSTKETFWLCEICRPAHPKVMHLTTDGRIVTPFRKKLQDKLKKEK